MARFLPFCRDTWTSLSTAELDKNDAHVVVQRSSAHGHTHVMTMPTSWGFAVIGQAQPLTSADAKHVLLFVRITIAPLRRSKQTRSPMYSRLVHRSTIFRRTL